MAYFQKECRRHRRHLPFREEVDQGRLSFQALAIGNPRPDAGIPTMPAPAPRAVRELAKKVSGGYSPVVKPEMSMRVPRSFLLLPMLAHAAADFTTIRRTTTNLSDASPQLLVSFTPGNVNLSTSTANSAVLNLEVLGSEYDFNEAYVNPPTTVCTANNTDANQTRSIGILQKHDDANLKTEWAANQVAFSSGFLKAGTNPLMICVRNVSGQAGSSVGNLDNISVRSIVLQYHTQ